MARKKLNIALGIHTARNVWLYGWQLFSQIYLAWKSTHSIQWDICHTYYVYTSHTHLVPPHLDGLLIRILSLLTFCRSWRQLVSHFTVSNCQLQTLWMIVKFSKVYILKIVNVHYIILNHCVQIILQLTSIMSGKDATSIMSGKDATVFVCQSSQCSEA